MSVTQYQPIDAFAKKRELVLNYKRKKLEFEIDKIEMKTDLFQEKCAIEYFYIHLECHLNKN